MKWLVRLKLPVNHCPGGTNSWAPPSDPYWLSCEIASRKASVFNVFPSPTPPKSVMEALWALQLIAEYSNESWILLLFPCLHSTPLRLSTTTTKISAHIVFFTWKKNKFWIKKIQFIWWKFNIKERDWRVFLWTKKKWYKEMYRRKMSLTWSVLVVLGNESIVENVKWNLFGDLKA